MRLLAAAILAALLASPCPAAAAPRGTVLEKLETAVTADAGFTEPQKAELKAALQSRFADYGLQQATGPRDAAIQVALRMIVEGSFDEVPADRVSGVAFAAYQAVARGAPAEVVEGIGLYGYRKAVPPERLAAWANGYAQMTAARVPPEVAADLVRATMENDWDDRAFDTFKWSFVQAAKQGFDTRAYATYLLGYMSQGGRKPGELTAQAQGYFRSIAKTGASPKLPAYEGVFTAKPAPAPAQARPAPTKPRETTPPPARPATRLASLWPGLERSARAYLGTPYVWGGVTRRGIDCSALTQNSYGENDVRIPRVSQQQWKAGEQVGSGAWRQGDLVFFNTLGHGVSHVGMVVDPKGPQFIHASSSKGVVIADLSKNYYRTRYLGARRIVD